VLPVLSRAEARALDRRATDEHGIPSIVLMENAGRGAAQALSAEFPRARSVVVVCGRGNNGGDGFVVARELPASGHRVRVFLVADPEAVGGDAAVQLAAWKAQGGGVERIRDDNVKLFDRVLADSDVVVDALFGTGLTRELSGLDRVVVERINAAARPIVSLDLPSGLDADRGVPLGAAVRATMTLTFAQRKRGLLTPLGAEHAGRVSVIDIGIPASLFEGSGSSAAEIEEADAACAITPRTRLSHKGTSGRVLVIAGSPGKVGAALLVAHGALRAGAGLVTLAGLPSVAEVFENRVLEAMTARIDPNAPEASVLALLERTDVAVVGPGVGFDETARRVVTQAVLGWQGPVVVDADAIAHFHGRATELARSQGALLITPHPGELAGLLGVSTAAIEADRFGAVARAVELTRATVLLKGAPTLIGAPGQRIAACPAGHPVLATGGSGDVLSGCLGTLLVGSDPYLAACSGAFMHGRAAERVAAQRGVDRGVLAHEVADELPAVIAGLSRQRPFVSR